MAADWHDVLHSVWLLLKYACKFVELNPVLQQHPNTYMYDSHTIDRETFVIDKIVIGTP